MSIHDQEDNAPSEDDSPCCCYANQGASEAVDIVIHTHVVGACEIHDGRFVFDLCRGRENVAMIVIENGVLPGSGTPGSGTGKEWDDALRQAMMMKR